MVLSHLWVVGRVVGTWVVPWVAAVVPVRYLQISNLISALFFSRGRAADTLAGPCPWLRVSGASRFRHP